MRNEWTIRLFSREHLDPTRAKEQLGAFASLGGGVFKPDRWGSFEPVRSQFSLSELEGPSGSLAEPFGSVLFVQGKPKRMEASIWNRAFPPQSPFTNPAFLTYWILDFDRSWIRRAPWPLITESFHALIQLTKADFGALTTLEEYRKKHTTRNRPSYRNGSPDLGMPGLYRVNLFSSGLARWLRIQDLPSEIAVPRVVQGGAIELVLGGTEQESTPEAALALQQAAIDWLGTEKFFNIQDPDRLLSGPEWVNVPSVPWLI